MNALTLRAIRDIRHERVPDPALQHPGDAIIRVSRAGLCGSDLHIYLGREPGQDPGTVMGHEFTGRVEAVGSAVTRFAPGDRVVSPFSTSCGRCFFCQRGLTARCVEGRLFGWVEKGVGLQGAQAELVRVPLADSTLFALPDDLPDEAALLIADVLPTGWFCARNAEVRSGDAVVVLGCGPVGLMAIVAALEQGAATVLAADSVPERLAAASRFGATPLRLGSDDPATAVREATEGRGADAVLEVVGSPEALRLAFDLVRPGGVVSAAGVHHEAQFAFSPLEAYDRNVTFRIGRCPARALMDEVLPLARRRTDLVSIVTHRFPLARGAEAYALFERRAEGCIKVMFEG